MGDDSLISQKVERTPRMNSPLPRLFHAYSVRTTISYGSRNTTPPPYPEANERSDIDFPRNHVVPASAKSSRLIPRRQIENSCGRGIASNFTIRGDTRAHRNSTDVPAMFSPSKTILLYPRIRSPYPK